MEENICIPCQILNSNKYNKLTNIAKVLLISLWVYHRENPSHDDTFTISHDQMESISCLPHSSTIRAIRELRSADFVWNTSGDKSMMKLAVDVSCPKIGSLTHGQLRLIKMLIPTAPRPARKLNNKERKHQVVLKHMLLDDDPRCYVCGCDKCLELHHVHYDRYGEENIFSDVVLLCGRCHSFLHDNCT